MPLRLVSAPTLGLVPPLDLLSLNGLLSHREAPHLASITSALEADFARHVELFPEDYSVADRAEAAAVAATAGELLFLVGDAVLMGGNTVHVAAYVLGLEVLNGFSSSLVLTAVVSSAEGEREGEREGEERRR